MAKPRNAKKQAKARAPASPVRGRQPVAQLPRSTIGDKATFSFEHIDRGHNGAWGTFDDAEACLQIVKLISEMSKLTWAEIRNQMTGPAHKRRRRNHSQPLSSLCKEAQDRVRDLRLDETFDDEMFRFRDGGTGRLWGFIQEGIFYVVWWDPGHDVCPSEKVHT